MEKGMNMVFFCIYLWSPGCIPNTYQKHTLLLAPLTVCFWYAIRYAFGMCAIPFSIPLHTLYLPFEVCFWYGKRYGFGIFFAYTFGHLVAYQIHIRNIPCLCFCFDHKYGMFLVCYYRYAFGMCAIT